MLNSCWLILLQNSLALGYNDSLILQDITLTAGALTAKELMTSCGLNSRCIIPAGTTVSMSSDINVAALVVQGMLHWTDTTAYWDHYLCSGYISVEAGGSFILNVSHHKAFIYIKVCESVFIPIKVLLTKISCSCPSVAIVIMIE